MSTTYGAQVDDVRNIIPGAEFPTQPKVGQRAVTAAMVRSYIEQVAASLSADLVGWEGLSVPRREAVEAAAKVVVVHGAAAFAQGARFPEQAAKGSDGYAAVLADRHARGARDLAEKVRGWLSEEQAGTGDRDGGGAAWSFPAPTMTETMRF